MKKTFFILLCLYNCTIIFSQNVKQHNIFMQKLNYSSEDYYSDNKGNLILFVKVYSSEQLNLGLLEINDSLTSKKISTSKKKYSYFLYEKYEKDTIENNFKLSKVTVNKTINSKGLRKIIFKKMPSLRTVFECNDKKYKNVLVLKSFFLTHSFISEDEESKKYSIKLIDENCGLLFEEDYDRNLLFSENDNLLILKNNNKIIIIYDKYS
jgi:hypothetical protein